MILAMALFLVIPPNAHATSTVAESDLRGNDGYSQISLTVALDICSDHDPETAVFVLDTAKKKWISTSCRLLKIAVEMSKPAEAK